MKDMSALEKLLNDGGKAGKIMNAVSSEEAARLERVVDKDALGAALAQGDVKSLEIMLRQVLSTGEGKALAKKISGIMDK